MLTLQIKKEEKQYWQWNFKVVDCQGMASEVSDIPSDRALVPNLVDRAFMSKYASAAGNHEQAFDSACNSDPLVWGVRVDDHTQTADPIKVGSGR